MTQAAAKQDMAPKDAPKGSISARNIDVYYGDKQAIKNVSLDMADKAVTSLIGPSGCGKSTFLRCINRMNDAIDICRVDGEIWLDGDDVNTADQDVVALRKKVGMVFQKPNPFPKSIWDNITYGPKLHGLIKNKSDAEQLVEENLKNAGLWSEVKDRLKEPGTSLSGGQQQRLCIARTMAIQPEVILMDEPCSALDPIATSKIEELIKQLENQFTIVIITHSMEQAKRVSSHTAFFHLGEIFEAGPTQQIFDNPTHERTREYIGGKIG